MTRREATIKLAEGVMGWPVTHQWDGREGIGETRVWVQDTSTVTAKKEPYDPWTDDCQALALVEAWRKTGLEHAYKIHSPCYEGRKGFCMSTYGTSELGYRKAEGWWWHLEVPTFAAALTIAVCETEGLEVDNE